MWCHYLPRGCLSPLIAVAAVVFLSSVWPLASGTSLAALVRGVVVRPLRQVDVFEAPASVPLSWIPIVLALAVAFVAMAYRGRVLEYPAGGAAVWGARSRGGGGVGDRACRVASGKGVRRMAPRCRCTSPLAFMSAVASSLRLALRFLVPLAVLQSLHAYPVAGEQRYWGTVRFSCPS